jgi:hypothetical protein
MNGQKREWTAFFYFIAFLFSFSTLSQEVEVLKVKGEAFVDANPITTGSKLKEGDEVKVVGSTSFIHMRFSDGSMMLQKEGTSTLKMIKPKKTLIKLLKGKLFIYKNPAVDSKLNVKTKTAALAVRGTKFYVEEGKETYLCVCEGVVAARNSGGTVDVKAGEDLFAPTRQSLTKKKAKAMMMEMASEGFATMGIPVE